MRNGSCSNRLKGWAADLLNWPVLSAAWAVGLGVRPETTVLGALVVTAWAPPSWLGFIVGAEIECKA